MKPEAILKRLKKIDEKTFEGLVEIWENQIKHEEGCEDCKATGRVICLSRPPRALDFSLDQDYTKTLIDWIKDSGEDLETLLEKKRQYAGP